jgi:lysophospholipase L1-like esterase
MDSLSTCSHRQTINSVQLRTRRDWKPTMITRSARFRFKHLLVIAIAALLLAELGMWIATPLADPYESERRAATYIRKAHPPHGSLRFEAEPGLPGMKGVTRWTTNNLGFRGSELVSPKPVGELRVFLIGGSTTECLILDDDDSLDAVIQRTLQERITDRRQVRVYNAGVSGERSDDHVAILTQRIVHLQPDIIVVFAGINDLRAAIQGHDYLHLRTQARPPWMLLATQSQLGRLAYFSVKLRPPVRKSALDEPSVTGYHYGVKIQKSARAASEPPIFDTRGYANNLRTLAGVAAGHGVALIFVTQQTTWNSDVDSTAKDWHWLLNIDNVRYAEEDMHHALERMNDSMRQTANSLDVPLYDLARLMPKSTEFFYDDVHFNTNGASVAGKQLAAVILEKTGPW